MDVRLDTLMGATVEELVVGFHRSRAAVLRAAMRWGLSKEPAEHTHKTPKPIPHLSFFVNPIVHQ